MAPRVLVAAFGLVAIVAISTALAPTSSNDSVPRAIAGVAEPRAPARKAVAGRRLARRTVTPVAAAAPVRARVVAIRTARVNAPSTPQRVVHRVAKAVRVQRTRRAAPVTTPPPPAPQPVAPAPQPPPANDERPRGDGNSGPGGGGREEDEDNSGPGGGGDGDQEENQGGGKDDKDKDEDKDEKEDNEEQSDEGEENEAPPPDDD
jgi:hypothetical protein